MEDNIDTYYVDFDKVFSQRLLEGLEGDTLFIPIEDQPPGDAECLGSNIFEAYVFIQERDYGNNRYNNIIEFPYGGNGSTLRSRQEGFELFIKSVEAVFLEPDAEIKNSLVDIYDAEIEEKLGASEPIWFWRVKYYRLNGHT